MEYTSDHTGGSVSIQYTYIYDLTNLFGDE